MSTFNDLDKLKSLRRKVDWEIESERYDLLNQLYPVVENWKGKLPNLRDIFRPEEIDWFLTEAVKSNKHEDKPDSLVEFVATSGYKDEPEVVEDDKPSSRRTTPIHHAARSPLRNRCIVRELFKVYDRFDVNYTDEFEFSHFHVACMYSCVDVVKKFLELGQDPDCFAQKSVDPPLQFALKNGDEELVGLLLRNGADPSMADAEGSTPLHTICKKNDDDRLAKMLFEISDEKHQLVQMDTKDKLGRTPLQLAVVYLKPNLVKLLLDRGADLSSFALPFEKWFGDGDESLLRESLSEQANFKLKLASSILAIVENLEQKGHELEPSDALMIMILFNKHKLFDKSGNLDEFWYDDENLVSSAKNLSISPNLSLYDLIRLRPEEAAKKLTCADYFNFCQSDELWKLPEGPTQAFTNHLCEKLSRGFFRRWALEPFLNLTQNQMSIEWCKKIIDQLMNEDLWHICLAATGKSCTETDDPTCTPSFFYDFV